MNVNINTLQQASPNPRDSPKPRVSEPGSQFSCPRQQLLQYCEYLKVIKIKKPYLFTINVTQYGLKIGGKKILK